MTQETRWTLPSAEELAKEAADARAAAEAAAAAAGEGDADDAGGADADDVGEGAAGADASGDPGDSGSTDDSGRPRSPPLPSHPEPRLPALPIRKVARSQVLVHRELLWDRGAGDDAEWGGGDGGAGMPAALSYSVTVQGPVPVDDKAPLSVDPALESEAAGGGSGVHTVFEGSDAACSVRGLRPNSKYLFRVTAAGDVPGVPSHATAVITDPVPPVSIDLSRLTPSSADLKWRPGRGGASRYAVYIGRLPSDVAVWAASAGRLPDAHVLGSRVPQMTLAYQGRTASARLSGLAPGQSYVVRVHALNAVLVHSGSGGDYFAALHDADGTAFLLTTPPLPAKRRVRRAGQVTTMEP